MPDLEPGKECTIGVRTKTTKPRFTMTGTQMKSLDIIANFTKPEAMAFILLKDNRDYESNIVRFSTSDLSKTDKVVFSKGYKALATKQLIIRLRKGVVSTYLFNPKFIIPKDYEDSLEMWDEAIKTHQLKEK